MTDTQESNGIQNARERFEQGDFDQAERIIRPLLDAQRDDIELQLFYAQCLSHLNRPQALVRFAIPLIESHPNHIGVNHLRLEVIKQFAENAWRLLGNGRSVEAQQLLTPIMTSSLARDNLEIQTLYAECLHRLGRAPEALKILQALAKHHESNTALQRMIQNIQAAHQRQNQERKREAAEQLRLFHNIDDVKDCSSNKFTLRLRRGLRSYLQIYVMLFVCLAGSSVLFVLEQGYLGDIVEHNQYDRLAAFVAQYRPSKITLIAALWPVLNFAWLLIPDARPRFDFVIDKTTPKVSVLFIKQRVFTTDRRSILLANITNAYYKQSVIQKLTFNSAINLDVNSSPRLAAARRQPAAIQKAVPQTAANEALDFPKGG